MRANARSVGTMPKSGETTVQSLKENIEEMRRLRKQMHELKGELRHSLAMLRANLRFAETDAHAQLSQPSVFGLATSLEALRMRTNPIRSNQTLVPRS